MEVANHRRRRSLIIAVIAQVPLVLLDRAFNLHAVKL